MAVYRFENGRFEKIASSMEELVPAFAEWNGSIQAFAGTQGMTALDDDADVFMLHARAGMEDARGPLAEYRWWFALVDTMDQADDVLIPDSFPDYLAFWAQLEPLIRRARAIKEEVLESLR